MEQITRRYGIYYYGEKICKNADDAYERFRDDYHRLLGKSVFRRLDMSSRKERVHGFHCYYDKEYEKQLEQEFAQDEIRVPAYLLGINVISYCYSVNIEDCPDYEEEKFFRWLDWALLNYGTVIKLKNRKSGTGRTSKRLKARYR